MDRSTSFIALAIVVAGLIIAGAVVVTRSPGPIKEYARTDIVPNTTANVLVDQLNQRIRELEMRLATTTPVAPLPTPTSTTVTAKKIFSAQGLEINYPGTWVIEKRSSSNWSILDGKKDIGTITCPIPETGFEGWDVESGFQKREFTKNGQSMRAELWMAAPWKGSEDLGWLARLAAGKKMVTDPDYIEPSQGCQAIFDVSNPPTTAERAILEEIYQSIK